MDINFSIEFDPSLVRFESGLKADVEKVSGELVREITELAPVEMRSLMGSNPPSARGQAPARRTGTLANSLQGQMIGQQTGQISMVHYAKYLDPFLSGHLERPFISRGIDAALVKVAQKL